MQISAAILQPSASLDLVTLTDVDQQRRGRVGEVVLEPPFRQGCRPLELRREWIDVLPRLHPVRPSYAGNGDDSLRCICRLLVRKSTCDNRCVVRLGLLLLISAMVGHSMLPR